MTARTCLLSRKRAVRPLVVPAGNITEPEFCPDCGQGYILEQFAVECSEEHQRKGEWP